MWQESLGIELASEPTSSSTLAAMFVVDAKVLYQLCSFGMADVDEVVDLTFMICLFYTYICLLWHVFVNV